MGLGSRGFEAAGALMSKPSMRPLTRIFSNLRGALPSDAWRRVEPEVPTMLLTVTGRKTGEPRTVPDLHRGTVARDRRGLRQQRHRPGMVVEPSGQSRRRRDGEGPDVPGPGGLAPADRQDELWRLVQMYPYFTGYQERTTRQIPVVILAPSG